MFLIEQLQGKHLFSYHGFACKWIPQVLLHINSSWFSALSFLIILPVFQLSGQLLTTYGYGAPEFESGIYTAKSDVYSFGVVMLELLTGRMSYDRYNNTSNQTRHISLLPAVYLLSRNDIFRSRTRGEQSLVRWAIPQLHDIGALTGMVDPALNGKYHDKSLSHFADIISRCVQVRSRIYLTFTFSNFFISKVSLFYRFFFLVVLTNLSLYCRRSQSSGHQCLKLCRTSYKW